MKRTNFKTRLAVRLTSVAATLLSAVLMMSCRAKKTVVDSSRPADEDTEITDPVLRPTPGDKDIMVLYGLAPTEYRVPVAPVPQQPAE